MYRSDPYQAAARYSLTQRRAGVEPGLADLVTAFARMRADRGEPVQYQEIDIASVHGSYRYLPRKNPDMDPRLLSFLVAYGQELVRRGMPVIFSVDHFARRQRISSRLVRWMAMNQSRYYDTFYIPKKTGVPRRIDAPKGRLLTMQRWIHRRVLARTELHPSATAFREGSSVVDNARPHAGKAVVVKMDLENFFPSIGNRRVRKEFQKLGYGYEVAALLANICTLNGCLPQGAPTSPGLSNLVGNKLDRRFAGLAKANGFSYTRYADDLVFSSNDKRLSKLIPLFREVVQEEGFRVNEGKVRIMRSGGRQKVTGLVVNEKPNLPRDHIRRLRAAADRMQKKQTAELPSRKSSADIRNVLQGHLGYLNMVRKQQNGIES